MELITKGECLKEVYTCPECGSHVKEHCYQLECEHCLRKREE